jgi:hypothetical protein
MYQQGTPGWQDEVQFLRAAHDDPAYWLEHARAAERNGATPAAGAHARRVLQATLPALASLFAEDGTKGDCRTRSLLAQRLLEAAGVWCWVAQGGMTALFPQEWRVRPIGYRPLNLEQQIGHCWVVAPPFRVVDLALRDQTGDGRAERRLPALLMAEQVEPLELSITDVADAPLLKFLGHEPEIPPALRAFNVEFPACRFMQQRIRYRYVPTAVTVPAAPLDMLSHRIAGLTPQEIFEDVFQPALRDAHGTEERRRAAG